MKNDTLTYRRIVMCLVVLTLALATAQAGIFLYQVTGDSAYGAKDIAFEEVRAISEGMVEIRFTSKLETLYYCPGANAKTTNKGIELSFVRSYMERKPKVTYPVTNVKNAVEMITVPTNGKAVFLRDGENLVELFPKE